MQAQLGLDNRQFELCALQPCSSPSGIAAVVVSYSALGGRYPVSCAVQVANGVLPRLGPRAFLPWSFSRPPGGNDRSELLPGRHSAFVAIPLHRPLGGRPHDGGAPMKSCFPMSTRQSWAIVVPPLITLESQMQAAFYVKQGPAREVLQVGEQPMPEPGPGEVRVHLKTSGVNPSDWKSRSGRT